MPEPLAESSQTPQTRKSVPYRVAQSACLLYVGVIALFAALQRRLVYAPDSRPALVAESGLNPELVRELQLPVEGAILQGWWCRAAPHQVTTESRPVVILFPGNAANRGRRGPLIQLWNELGCDVVIFDYRGYGGSTGTPSEAALCGDALAVWELVNSGEEVAPGQIILCGQSLGGGVAISLAHYLRQHEVRPAGLVLQYTFTSLVDVGSEHYPWLPVRWILRDRFPSLARIAHIDLPLLVVHGRRDRIVPFHHGEQLFQAAPAQSWNGIARQFSELPEAGHNDVLHVHRPELAAALRHYLDQLRQTDAESQVQ
jgi:fermentation-respiration switch protein FrsA (DUF1100 family)